MNKLRILFFILSLFSCHQENKDSSSPECSLKEYGHKYSYYSRTRQYTTNAAESLHQLTEIAEIISDKVGNDFEFDIYPYRMTKDTVVLFFNQIENPSKMKSIACAFFENETFELGDFKAVFFCDSTNKLIKGYSNK